MVISEEQLRSIFEAPQFAKAVEESVGAIIGKAIGKTLPEILPQSLAPSLELQTKNILASFEAKLDERDKKIQDKLDSIQVQSGGSDDSVLAARLHKLGFSPSPGATASTAASSGQADGFATPLLAGSRWADHSPAIHSASTAVSPPVFGSPPVLGSPAPSFASNPYSQLLEASSGSFDRKIDQNVVVITSKDKENIKRPDMVAFAKELLVSLGMEKVPVEVEGIAASPKFLLRFTCPMAGARHCKQVLDAQKLGPGKWQEHSIVSASGGQCRIFLNPDKSAKMVNGEIGVRRLLQLLREEHNGREFMCCNRQDNMVAQSWTPFVQVVVHGPIDVRLRWVPNNVSKLNINRTTIEASFASDLGLGANLQWE